MIRDSIVAIGIVSSTAGVDGNGHDFEFINKKMKSRRYGICFERFVGTKFGRTISNDSSKKNNIL